MTSIEPANLTNPDVSFSDWQLFVKNPPVCLDQVIEREICCLPDWFVPVARGCAIASDALLRSVGSPRSTYDWHRGYFSSLESSTPPKRETFKDPNQPGVFEAWRSYNDGEYAECLLVRQLQNQLWTVEACEEADMFCNAGEVVVHSLGSTPILARTLSQAQQLAASCRERKLRFCRLPHGLRWSGTLPGVQFLYDLAHDVEFQERHRQWQRCPNKLENIGSF